MLCICVFLTTAQAVCLVYRLVLCKALDYLPQGSDFAQQLRQADPLSKEIPWKYTATASNKYKNTNAQIQQLRQADPLSKEIPWKYTATASNTAPVSLCRFISRKRHCKRNVNGNLVLSACFHLNLWQIFAETVCSAPQSGESSQKSGLTYDIQWV